MKITRNTSFVIAFFAFTALMVNYGQNQMLRREKENVTRAIEELKKFDWAPIPLLVPELPETPLPRVNQPNRPVPIEPPKFPLALFNT